MFAVEQLYCERSASTGGVTRRPSCGDQAGGECDNDEHTGDCRKREWIRRPHAEEQGVEIARQGERRRESEHDAGDDEPHALSDDER